MLTLKVYTRIPSLSFSNQPNYFRQHIPFIIHTLHYLNGNICGMTKQQGIQPFCIINTTSAPAADDEAV